MNRLQYCVIPARLSPLTLAITLMCPQLLSGATVTFSNIQQTRDPAGPPGLPDDSLPGLLRMPTPDYSAEDDGVNASDIGEAEFRYTFDVEVESGATATFVALRQSLMFDFGAPGEASNYVRTETLGLITFTEINGAPVDPGDPANQQPFVLERTFLGSDLPGPDSIDTIVPLIAPATAFSVSLDNTLTAFSVEDTAIIEARDLRFSVSTAVIPEPGALALHGAAAAMIVGTTRRRNGSSFRRGCLGLRS